MVKFEQGNVLLKPSHRRQVMTWLKRSIRLGERKGDFALTLSMRRVGRQYDIRALVNGTAGNFNCHARRQDWRNAMRDVTWSLNSRLHGRSLSGRR